MKISIYNQKRNYSGIYKIDFPNGKSYIGQSNNIVRRIREHNSENKQYAINNAINKYGKVTCFTLLEEISPDNKELMNEREIYYISLYDTTNKEKGYNISTGGQGAKRVIADNIKKLQQDIINSNKTFEELSLLYNIDLTSISEINQGKRYYNGELSYPLRAQKVYHSRVLNENEIEEIRKILKINYKITIKEIGIKYNVSEMVIQRINQGKSPYFNDTYVYPIRRKNQNFCKFDQEDIEKIINLLKNSSLTQIEIANQFNCGRKIIGEINSGKKYYLETEEYPIRRR